MTNRAWLALYAAVSVTALVAGCGSDEATGGGSTPTGGSVSTGGKSSTGGTDDGGDPGSILTGGTDSATGGRTGGTGGTAAGAPSTGGKAATGGAAPTGDSIGQECLSDASCTGLDEFCLTAEEAGVPRGMCTTPCLQDSDCPNEEGVCLTFIDPDTSETLGICLEGCQVGVVPPLGLKCHDRPELTCSVLYLINGEECTTDADCTAPALCDGEGMCRSPAEACYPSCGNDLECPEDWFCNPRTGACQEEEPMGDPNHTPCDPELAEDPCLGRCASFVDEMDVVVESICVQDCKFLAPGQCGWLDTTQPAEEFCFPRFQESGEGDQGLCYELCNCSDECTGDHLCFEYPQDPDGFEMLFGRRGVCFADDGSETLEACQ